MKMELLYLGILYMTRFESLFQKNMVKMLVWEIPGKFLSFVGKTEERIIRVTLKYPEGTSGVFYYIKFVLKTEDPDNILLLR